MAENTPCEVVEWLEVICRRDIMKSERYNAGLSLYSFRQYLHLESVWLAQQINYHLPSKEYQARKNIERYERYIMEVVMPSALELAEYEGRIKIRAAQQEAYAFISDEQQYEVNQYTPGPLEDTDDSDDSDEEQGISSSNESEF